MKTSPNEGSRNWLPPLFCWLYAAVLLWILGLLTLGQPSLSSYYRYPICVSNAILLPLAAVGPGGAVPYAVRRSMPDGPVPVVLFWL